MCYDIIVRYCGKIGFIGILVVNEKEVFRTGKHYLTAEKAFNKVQDMKDDFFK